MLGCSHAGRVFGQLVLGTLFSTLFGTLLFLHALMAAAAEPVRVTSVTGSVEYRPGPDASWQAVEAGMTLPVPMEIRTHANGEAALDQAGSSFQVKSDSHVTLQATPEDRDGLVSRIKQWFGTVFYSVERKPDEFSVETPFLVSTVKGTRFVIVSGESASFVTLVEGSLEVLDIDSGQRELLIPGDVVGSGADQAGVQTFHSETRTAGAASTETTVPSGQSEVEDREGEAEREFESALDNLAEIATEQQVVDDIAQEDVTAPDDDMPGEDGSSGDDDMQPVGPGVPDDGGDDDMGSGGGDHDDDEHDDDDHDHGEGDGHGHDHGHGHGHDDDDEEDDDD